MPLGETFLGAFLGALLKVLTSPELVRFLRQEGFETKINKWETTLTMINAVLGDAEEKQLMNNEVGQVVKKWLDDLEELAYDAEDMLDEFEYEATARKMKMDQLQSSKFWKHVPAGFCNWSRDAIKFRFRMRSKLNDVTTRFDRLCQLRQGLGLRVNTEGAPSTSSAAPQRPPTSSLPTGAVYGRDADKVKILEMVLKNGPNDPSNILAIPIVGMGGVGKTTLAREVYNHKEVKSFEVKAWVCVSDGAFDVNRVSMSILNDISGCALGQKDFNTVHRELKQKIDGKRFLLVLDDVWSISYGDWETFRSPFMESALGSRIIVTTRNQSAASTMSLDGFHPLGVLSDEDCWSVFSMCIIEKNEAVLAHPHFELIRKNVIEKCKGLPLAAKTLGGLLRTEEIDEWLRILNSKLWYLSENEAKAKEIPAALKLSYYHLPSHLRKCFAYCSIFPKDYEFEIEEVVLFWIGEGLVQQSTENKQPEEFGRECFDDLLGRSLFQQSSSGNGHKFVMHDLIHDLALWAFGERCLRLDGVSAANGQLEGWKKVRHVSYISGRYDSEKRFKVFQEVEDLKAKIRTFIPISQKYCYQFIGKSCLFDLLPKLKRLRVLSLQKYRNVMVSIPIRGLIHLRYLNLSQTLIRSLPESTCLLYNLQILLLRYCSRLEKWPSNFKYLIKLRHLDIQGATAIKEMPLGMEKLQNLQKLSDFIVGEGVCSNLKDLMSLSMLHGELRISNLENVISCDHEILRNKKDLIKLLLVWGYQSHKLQSEDTEEKVLTMLRPHENLQELTIKGYGGSKLPRWVGDASYSNMKVLTLEDCERCTYLPSLGVLASLEELTIKRMKLLTCISSMFDGKGQIFKSLEVLCFEDLPVWVNWERIEENEYGDAFPCLKKLFIKKCPQLFGSLPGRLFALEELVIEDCEQLVVSFPNIPKLCKIKINGCRRIACDNPVDFKSIRYLRLSKISEFSNQLMQECFGKPEPQQIKHNRFEDQLDEIRPEKPLMGGLQSIEFLIELVISECSNIVSFPEVCSLPHLRKLFISNCDALISLPEEMKIKNTCLESLQIFGCKSLAFIVRGQLPATLKDVWFRSCPQLTKLSQSGLLPASLKHLTLDGCGQLSTITEGFHGSNTSLEVILIMECENLQITNGLYNFRHLRRLEILHCPSIECFPEGGLSANLRRLDIICCKKLKALPIGLRSLNSLEDLEIRGCPSITSFNPEEEFPTNLKSLSIRCENVCRSLVEWGLHNLTSLTSLRILDIPQQEMEMMFPPSLTDLSISGFPKLTSQGFQNLTSLQSLVFSDCPDLTSLGDQGLPSSLKRLHISKCENLTCFPKQGLPSSLLSLDISDCPKLKEECKRNKGREWSKISNIPEVWINGIPIFELEEDEEAQSSSCYRSCLINPMHCCKSTKHDTLYGSSTIND